MLDNSIQAKAGLLTCFTNVSAETLAACLCLLREVTPSQEYLVTADLIASLKQGSNGSQYAAIEGFGVGSLSL